MSVSTSRLSFQDCFDVLDKAIDSERGVKVGFLEEGEARQYQVRINKARVLDRRENLNTYEEGDVLYGRSVYDPIMAQVKFIQGKWWLFLRKRSIDSLVVEPIEDEPVSEEPQLELTTSIGGSGDESPHAAAPATPTGIRRL